MTIQLRSKDKFNVALFDVYEPFKTKMRVPYNIFTFLKSPLVGTNGSLKQHSIARTTSTYLLVVTVVLNCIQSTVCVVQGPRNRQQHKNGDNSGAREVGTVVIHGKQGSAQGSEISYSIAVENAQVGEESKYYSHPNSRPADNQDIPDDENESDDQLAPNVQQIRWAEAAYRFVKELNCSEVFFTTERECRNLKRQSKSDMTVHIADPTPQGRLATILPDGGLSKSGLHDAVVVLDPYPAANYGHLVLVFYVDIHMGESWCQRQGGTFLGEKIMALRLNVYYKKAL